MSIDRIVIIAILCNIQTACAPARDGMSRNKDMTPMSVSGTFDANVLHSSGWHVIPGGAWADAAPAELVIDAGPLAGCIGGTFSASAAASGALTISLTDRGGDVVVLEEYGPKLEERTASAEGDPLDKPIIVARLSGDDGDIAAAKATSWELLVECP